MEQQELKNFYIKHSKIKQSKQNSYKKYILKKINNDNKRQYYDKLQKSFYIYETYKTDDNSLVSANLTLPSAYDFKSVNEQKNIFKTIFQDLYNHFKVPLKFIKIFEINKDNLNRIHLHAVLFIPNYLIEDFKKHYLKIINKYGLKQHKLIVNKNKDEDIKTITYLLKSFKQANKDINYYHFINGFATYNNIQLFSCSKLPISGYIYKKLYYKLSEEIKENYKYNNKNFNYYLEFEKLCNIKISILTDDKIIEKNINKNPQNEKKYNVEIIRKRVQKHKINPYSGEIKSYYVYKTLSFELERNLNYIVNLKEKFG